MTLECSIRAGDLAATSTLLRAGADVNRPGPDGFPPLLLAAGLGQAQLVDLLLTVGADVLAVDKLPVSPRQVKVLAQVGFAQRSRHLLVALAFGRGEKG